MFIVCYLLWLKGFRIIIEYDMNYLNLKWSDIYCSDIILWLFI